jgi:hypothetical protein
MRQKDSYYSRFSQLSVLTDEEFNELVFIEEVFTTLSNNIPDNSNNELSKYISSYLIERNTRSWNLINIANDRLNKIINLCIGNLNDV